jgi:hypothetical protein
VKCYWQKTQKTNLIEPPADNPFSQLVTKHHSLVVDENVNGINVKPLVELLVQLCIGSLGQNIPPQDTQLALEGMIALRNQHNIFHVIWFQDNYWMGLFLPCLRVRKSTFFIVAVSLFFFFCISFHLPPPPLFLSLSLSFLFLSYVASSFLLSSTLFLLFNDSPYQSICFRRSC